jgi:hypothetical protein
MGLEVFIMTHHKIKSVKSKSLVTSSSGGGRRQKDVKNEGWPDYMLENTDPEYKMSIE